jgi:hypothetical protein
MSFQAKRELLMQTGARYSEADGPLKSKILDEFVLATGYDRKYATRLLNRPLPPPASTIKRPRARKYGATVHEALLVTWRAANCICAKRLVPFLAELVPLLEGHGHLDISSETRTKLLAISAATADRLLRSDRAACGVKGMSTTKAGSLLKKQIPLRTFTEWQDSVVGFFEVDLVAHCGTNVAGTFLWTLVMTDVASGWTECYALPQRSGSAVVQAVRHLQKLLPFPILGLDTDNGSEFINEHLLSFCNANGITFTRGRVHRKNDQCFVEQKNGNVVRQLVGYDRYDGALALRQLSELYRAVRLYVNFFQPSMKLRTKSREGASVHRTYSPAKTPLQRILAGSNLDETRREQLSQLRLGMDPVLLLRMVQTLQDALWRYALAASSDGYQSGCEEPPVTFVLGALPQEPCEAKPRKYRHSERPRAPRTYRTRLDPFEPVDSELYSWFLTSPEATAANLLNRLQEAHPDKYPDNLLRTLQRKVSRWRQTTPIEFVSPWDEGFDTPALRATALQHCAPEFADR